MRKVVRYEVVNIKCDGFFPDDKIEVCGELVDYKYSAETKSYESIRFKLNTGFVHEITNIPKNCVTFFEREKECI